MEKYFVFHLQWISMIFNWNQKKVQLFEIWNSISFLKYTNIFFKRKMSSVYSKEILKPANPNELHFSASYCKFKMKNFLNRRGEDWMGILMNCLTNNELPCSMICVCALENVFEEKRNQRLIELTSKNR